jgi:4-hydroxyphenylpyruvate dioxygenase-like putative hemolysin
VHICGAKKLYGFSYQATKNGNQITTQPTGLKYIDHMVGNVGWNEMNTWVKFYEEVMDLLISFL